MARPVVRRRLDLFDNITGMRDYSARQKRAGKRVVFVPTMGALHDGHGACVRRGRAVENGVLVVSIFVNTTQFGPDEDLDAYPRTLEQDLMLCGEWGVDAVFAPPREAMYPSGSQRAWVTVEELTAPLCGGSRPGHFRGVTTVVTKLFNIVQPDVAVFGQKDAQQVLVIRDMARQLDMPVEILVAPVAREADGMARSSRNTYLSETERQSASAINRALRRALDRVNGGERDPAVLADMAERDMNDGGVENVEYVDLLAADDLSALNTVEGKVILAVAARVGKTRLIDNIVFCLGDDGTADEVPLF